MSPTKEPWVSAALHGLQRKHAKPVTKKKPFTIGMLRAIVEEARTNFLSDLRLAIEISYTMFVSLLCLFEV